MIKWVGEEGEGEEVEVEGVGDGDDVAGAGQHPTEQGDRHPSLRWRVSESIVSADVSPAPYATCNSKPSISATHFRVCYSASLQF